MTDDAPDLATVIELGIDSTLVDVHTGQPGKVVSYDATSQTAEIEPQFRRVVRRQDGSRVVETVPNIPGVPVGFPCAGGFFLTFPVQPGDTGLIVFTEYALDRWLSAGEAVDPGDTRRFTLAGAVFLPISLRPRSSPIGDASPSHAMIGYDGGFVARITTAEIQLPAGAATALARADRVDAELAAIAATLATGTSPSGAVTFGTPYSPGSTGADLVKGT